MGMLLLSPQLQELVEALQLRLSTVPPGPIKVIDPVRCVDGVMLSVQASTCHACFPRRENGPYQNVEVYAPRGLFPARYKLEDEQDVDDDHIVYRHVPVDVVAFVIQDHGGISPD